MRGSVALVIFAHVELKLWNSDIRIGRGSNFLDSTNYVHV